VVLPAPFRGAAGAGRDGYAGKQLGKAAERNAGSTPATSTGASASPASQRATGSKSLRTAPATTSPVAGRFHRIKCSPDTGRIAQNKHSQTVTGRITFRHTKARHVCRAFAFSTPMPGDLTTTRTLAPTIGFRTWARGGDRNRSQTNGPGSGPPPFTPTGGSATSADTPAQPKSTTSSRPHAEGQTIRPTCGRSTRTVTARRQHAKRGKRKAFASDPPSPILV
jgi:hypothetical protein